MTYDFVTKDKPRWYQLRWKLSNLFVKIARKIYPENPEVSAFMSKMLMDYAIYGRTIVHVNQEEVTLNTDTSRPNTKQGV